MAEADGDIPERAIVSFHKDEQGDWFARLECGHHQHTRHDPPWTNRPWIETESGRVGMLGERLRCKKCRNGTPPDTPPDTPPERQPN